MNNMLVKEFQLDMVSKERESTANVLHSSTESRREL